MGSKSISISELKRVLARTGLKHASFESQRVGERTENPIIIFSENGMPDCMPFQADIHEDQLTRRTTRQIRMWLAGMEPEEPIDEEYKADPNHFCTSFHYSAFFEPNQGLPRRLIDAAAELFGLESAYVNKVYMNDTPKRPPEIMQFLNATVTSLDQLAQVQRNVHAAAETVYRTHQMWHSLDLNSYTATRCSRRELDMLKQAHDLTQAVAETYGTRYRISLIGTSK